MKMSLPLEYLKPLSQPRLQRPCCPRSPRRSLRPLSASLLLQINMATAASAATAAVGCDGDPPLPPLQFETGEGKKMLDNLLVLLKHYNVSEDKGRIAFIKEVLGPLVKGRISEKEVLGKIEGLKQPGGVVMSSFNHRGQTFRNRIGLSPLTRGRATYPAGLVTDLHVQYYTQRATGGFIITEATAISKRAHGWFKSPGIWTSEQV